jgi:hypothetical protein
LRSWVAIQRSVPPATGLVSTLVVVRLWASGVAA